MSAWNEVSGVLAGAMENASEEALAQPATGGPPSADGKVSGIVNFLAIHETYHVGQAAYLSCWMGHKGIMGEAAGMAEIFWLKGLTAPHPRCVAKISERSIRRRLKRWDCSGKWDGRIRWRWPY